MERSFTLHRRQRQQRSGQPASCTAHDGLAQSQVPMAGREYFVVRPCEFFAEQGRDALIVEENGQRVASLLVIRKVRVAETFHCGVPIGTGKDFIAKLIDVAGNEQDGITKIDPANSPTIVEAPPMSRLSRKGHLSAFTHSHVTGLRH